MPWLEKEQVLGPEHVAILPSLLLHYILPPHFFRLGMQWIWERTRLDAGGRGEDTETPFIQKKVCGGEKWELEARGPSGKDSTLPCHL